MNKLARVLWLRSAMDLNCHRVLLRWTLTMNSYDELLRWTLTMDSYAELSRRSFTINFVLPLVARYARPLLALTRPLLALLGRFWLSLSRFWLSTMFLTSRFWLSTGHFWLLIVSIGSQLYSFGLSCNTYIHILVRRNGVTAKNVSLGEALLLGQRLLDPG